jgi:hypothetical protein
MVPGVRDGRRNRERVEETERRWNWREKSHIENENDFGENLKFEIWRNWKERKKEKDLSLESHETRWVLSKVEELSFSSCPFYLLLFNVSEVEVG